MNAETNLSVHLQKEDGQPQTNNYLESAISKIYGEDDDFIVIGLTGRTGSGCSTVAKILAQPLGSLKHSLFAGDQPSSNQQRKERIVARFVSSNWVPFSVIQVRSILTLMLSECDSGETEIFLKKFLGEDEREKLSGIVNVLASINTEAASLEKTHEELRKYFTITLPQKSEQIRVVLKDSEFIKLYQLIGKNVRNSGNPIASQKNEGMFFALADRINEVVKSIRDAKRRGEKTFIVIDAIRNPFEAIYFQDRYAAFHLMAISCEDGQRKARLRALGHTDSDIKIIDAQEYPDVKISNKSAYVLQDIAACLERADLYVNNPDMTNLVSEFHNLTNQVLTFVSLMRRPGLVTPTALERCMQFAYTAKLNSGCISRQVGAVITDENFSIQAVGWNDTPHGQVPCNLRNRFDLEAGVDQPAYSNYEKSAPEFLVKFKERSLKYIKIAESGRNISYCFKSEHQINTDEKNQVHTRALHAEENAFLQIAKYGGRGIEGGKLFTTASPCELCSKKAYQLGIREIYYIDPYPGIAVRHILMGGSNDPKLTLFSGAIGRAFHRLYTPIVPYKDELATLAVGA